MRRPADAARGQARRRTPDLECHAGDGVTPEKGRLGVDFSCRKDVYVLEHPTPWAQVSERLSAS